MSLVKRMREAQKEEAAFEAELDRKYRGNTWFMSTGEMAKRQELCNKVFDLNSEVDEYLKKMEKKTFVIQGEYLDNDVIPCQYDSDTIFDMPNFPKGNYVVNVGKKEYLGYIYDEFIKVPEDGYYTYDFALVNNGKVIAIGDEQGRCGGVYCSCRDKSFEDRLKKSPVYDKVKHLPIATSEELEEPIYKYFNSHNEYERYMEQLESEVDEYLKKM